MNDSTSQFEVLERSFSGGSIFGPQLRNEFLARCSDATPTAALESLLNDLFDRSPQPLFYSRLPLDQVGQVVLNPRADLLLSHIELAQARGLISYRFSSLSEAADEYYTREAKRCRFAPNTDFENTISGARSASESRLSGQLNRTVLDSINPIS